MFGILVYNSDNIMVRETHCKERKLECGKEEIGQVYKGMIISDDIQGPRGFIRDNENYSHAYDSLFIILLCI